MQGHSALFWSVSCPWASFLTTVGAALQLLQQAYLLYRRRYFYPVLINLLTFPALHNMGSILNQQHSKVMALMNETRLTPMVQGRWVRAIASHRLVPGDVIVLHKGRALNDMVLLRGVCMVTESMLSGEVSSHQTHLVPVLYARTIQFAASSLHLLAGS